MANKNIKKVIAILQKRLKQNNIKWAVVGSTNMQLQGMRIEPHDLDIVIQYKDLKKISEIFYDYSASSIMELKALSSKPAWEVRATIEGVDIQFSGGDENEVYVSKLLSGRIIMIKIDHIEIPCFTLEAESQSYKETNRKHRARLIQEFLSNQGN